MNNIEYFKKLEENLDYDYYEDICLYNSNKVLTAFKKCNVSESSFNKTTGYGYGDIGRDTIEEVYKTIFSAEDSLVRTQFISGTHAIQTALFALLRPGDLLLSISGTPYDTLHEVIGIRANDSSLMSFQVKYDEIDLKNNDFDDEKIINYIKNNKVKVIEIQRSKGYSLRKSLSIEKVKRIIKKIKEIDKNIIVMVDNCYCEFVNKEEPIEVGADICVGSLIKNLGGCICENGGYIVGRKDLIKLCSERLNVVGEAKEVGPSLGANKSILQGLAFAPSVVLSSIKISLLTSKLMEDNNILVEPKSKDKRVDIVTTIMFNDKDLLINYCKLIQKYSLIDSNVIPMPTSTPGYDDEIIMASGSFIQGSSIELSCDGPIRSPYVAYQQGSMTYEYGKLALMKIYDELFKKGKQD